MTTQDLKGIQLGFINALDDPDVADIFLRQDGIKDKIAVALGTTADEIQARHLKEFINKFKLDGVGFIMEGADLEVISTCTKSISDLSVGVSYTSGEALFRDALGFDIVTDQIVDADRYKIIESMSRIYEQTEGLTPAQAQQRALDRAWGIVYDNVYQHYNLGTKEVTTLTSKSVNQQLLVLKNELEAGDEMASVQIASFLGFVEQNKEALPTKIVRTRTAIGTDYFKNQAKKMIYLDGPQNILNPASFYARALFANLATAGCEGNSLCTYSHAAIMENPLYLSKDADKYFIRVWRPVEAWKQWLGWQAALQHIPENPRFYVVSPCMATAKIWKTTYYGEPTIFVYPEKVDIGDSASNYCYADSNLVNQYTEIWFASDTATLITSILPFLKLPKAATELVGKIIGYGDPITLAQGIAEGAISWPSWPFKTLTWEQISANSGKIGIKEIEKGMETK
jgi:hypothetical protein